MMLNQVTHTLRLREYYYMLVRHKIIFICVVACFAAGAAAVSFTLPRVYRAETALLVEDEDILNPLISGLAITPSASARLRTLRDELLSWPRLTLLVEKLGLDKNVKNPLEYEQLINDLRKSIGINLRGAQLVAVRYEGQDPKEAQRIVQTLSDIIVEGTLTSQRIEASSAIEFIEKQMDEYREKLESSEETLRKYREIYNSSLPVATRMNEQLVALKLELNNLLIENTEEHPRVIHVRQVIESIENQRDAKMEVAQAEGANIDPSVYAKLATSVPRQEQHLAKLQRDYAVNSRIYQSLASRLETAKLSETLEESKKGPKFKVLEPARLPLRPVKPRVLLVILAGVVLGVGFGLAVIYLIELSNTSIRNLDEAREILELPIFGSIPPIRPEELLIQESLRHQASV